MDIVDLPHSQEAEIMYLGSLLLDFKGLADKISLEKDDFYFQRNGKIFDFMIYLDEIGQDVDMLSIATVAADDIEEIGGFPYLRQILEYSGYSGSFEQNQEIIRSKSIMRRSITTMSRSVIAGRSAHNPIEYLTGSIEALQGILQGLNDKAQKSMRKLSDVSDEHKETIHTRREQKGLTGAKSCSAELSKMTGGYQKGDLIITAARPSIGKTAFALNEAEAAASDYLLREINGCVAIFSLEMNIMPLFERSISINGNLPMEKMARPNEMTPEDWERYEMATARIKQLPIFFEDSPDQSLRTIEQKIKEIRKQYDEVFVIIDYLQLVESGLKTDRNDDKVKHVSKTLKRFARKYDVAINAISAVGRSCEQRQDKRPMMSDLRESGSIESDADIVIFLYRDDYYNKESERKGIIELIVAKGRNIGTGTIEMAYIRKTSKFLDLDYSHHEQKKKG